MSEDFVTGLDYLPAKIKNEFLERYTYKPVDVVLKDINGHVTFERHGVYVPTHWSYNEYSIFVSKYMMKTGVPPHTIPLDQKQSWHGPRIAPDGDVELRPEMHASETFNRLCLFWTHNAVVQGHIDEEDAIEFYLDCFDMLYDQIAFPNSPQWFNAGVGHAYGFNKSIGEVYSFNNENREVRIETDAGKFPQLHACFLNTVEDSLTGKNSIFDWIESEMKIFKYGGGSGVNASAIRGAGEPLSNGGVSSGLLSFLRIANRNAGAIKSGGFARRAAKMVLLNCDHPDLFEFINWKVSEERKAAYLHIGSKIDKDHQEAVSKYLPQLKDFHNLLGPHYIDLDWRSEAYDTVSGQNSNNSIILTEEFWKAHDTHGKWYLRRRTDGEVSKETTTQEVLSAIAKAAWLCGDPGVLFDGEINKWHTCKNDGRIDTTNPCSEYMFLQGTACNLASLNLVKFYYDNTTFDVDKFIKYCELLTIILDLSVTAAGYPTEKIAKGSKNYRTLGLGYCNLGGLLMRMGVPYDSDEGRRVAKYITALMNATSYRKSAELAHRIGTYPRFSANRVHHLEVLNMHARDINDVSDGLYSYIAAKAQDVYMEARNLANKHGLRNAQMTLVAPTGTIGLVMGVDTTGIEPVFSLLTYKTIDSGEYMVFVPKVVEDKLSEEEVEAIKNGQPDPIKDPYLKEVFKTAGEMSWKAHVDMMAAVQPQLSGSISKTVNMPSDCTVDDVLYAYTYARERKLKSLALFRDGCKFSQVLSTSLSGGEKELIIPPKRQKLPDEREGVTHKFNVAGTSFYIRTGKYKDGRLGEIFVNSYREGADYQALMSAFARLFSIALQYGIPIEDLVNKFEGVEFEPKGIAKGLPNKTCSSPIDGMVQIIKDKYIDESVESDREGTSSVQTGKFCHCGGNLEKSGTCYVCTKCGSTTGCA